MAATRLADADLPRVVRELRSTGSYAENLHPRQLRFEELLSPSDSAARPFYAYASHLRHALRSARRADFVEVFAVARGWGCDVVVETRNGAHYSREVEKGQMFLFRPFDVTRLSVKAHASVTGISVMIPVAVWDAYAAFVGLSEISWLVDEPPTATFDAAEASGLRPFVEALEHSLATPSRVDALRFLVDVVPRLFPLPPSAPGGVGPTWLIRSVDEMRGNEANLRGGVARLTELAHVSSQYLASSVRRHYGTTPSLLIRRFRLERAANLLTTTTLAVGEIARRCGYTSQAHFSNCFRSEYRVTALEFRARARASAH